MTSPIPRHVAIGLEAVHHTAWAVADALEHNKTANPYAQPTRRIDVEQLAKELIRLQLGKDEGPIKIDPVSALYGAAVALGVSLNQDSIEWIKQTPC